MLEVREPKVYEDAYTQTSRSTNPKKVFLGMWKEEIFINKAKDTNPPCDPTLFISTALAKESFPSHKKVLTPQQGLFWHDQNIQY